MNLNEAARVLGISPRTLRLAVERGDLDAAHPLPDGPGVFQRQALEAPAAAALVARVRDRNHQPSYLDGHSAISCASSRLFKRTNVYRGRG
jgi:hypothetical protein